MSETIVIAEEDEDTGRNFSWGLAFAGAVTATAVTFFLLTLGSGFGLMLVHPATTSAPTFLTGGAIYFLIAQTFGFAVGGHLVGRLLGPIVDATREEEVPCRGARLRIGGGRACARLRLRRAGRHRHSGPCRHRGHRGGEQLRSQRRCRLWQAGASETIDVTPTAYLASRRCTRPGGPGAMRNAAKRHVSSMPAWRVASRSRRKTMIV